MQVNNFSSWFSKSVAGEETFYDLHYTVNYLVEIGKSNIFYKNKYLFKIRVLFGAKLKYIFS